MLHFHQMSRSRMRTLIAEIISPLSLLRTCRRTCPILMRASSFFLLLPNQLEPFTGIATLTKADSFPLLQCMVTVYCSRAQSVTKIYSACSSCLRFRSDISIYPSHGFTAKKRVGRSTSRSVSVLAGSKLAGCAYVMIPRPVEHSIAKLQESFASSLRKERYA